MKYLPAVLPLAAALAARPAAADPTSGVDAALFRSAYDAGGVFSLEGARLLPRRDLSFTMLLSYARSPLTLAIRQGMIASVSGMRMIIAVPTPG